MHYRCRLDARTVYITEDKRERIKRTGNRHKQKGVAKGNIKKYRDFFVLKKHHGYLFAENNVTVKIPSNSPLKGGSLALRRLILGQRQEKYRIIRKVRGSARVLYSSIFLYIRSRFLMHSPSFKAIFAIRSCPHLRRCRCIFWALDIYLGRYLLYLGTYTLCTLSSRVSTSSSSCRGVLPAH
jgi:hypothetical protein